MGRKGIPIFPPIQRASDRATLKLSIYVALNRMNDAAFYTDMCLKAILNRSEWIWHEELLSRLLTTEASVLFDLPKSMCYSTYVSNQPPT